MKFSITFALLFFCYVQGFPSTTWNSHDGTTEQPKPECNCSTPEIFNISTYDSYVLYPQNLTNGQYCSYMNCHWRINFYGSDSDILELNGQSLLGYDAILTIYICETKQLLGKFPTEEIDTETFDFYTQESGICVTFFSKNVDNNNSSWNISFQKMNATLMDLSLEVGEPIKVFHDGTNGVYTLFRVFSDSGPLEIFIQKPVSKSLYVYDSLGLKNYIGQYTELGLFQSFNSSKGVISVLCDSIFLPGSLQIIYRNPKEHSKNCINMENFAYVNYSNITHPNVSYYTTDAGPCIFMLLSPIYGLKENKITSLNLITIEYHGNNAVKVFRGSNQSVVLFEFGESDAYLWNGVNIYGDLISFILPPNSNITLEYDLGFDLTYSNSQYYNYANLSKTYNDSFNDILINPPPAELMSIYATSFGSNLDWILTKSINIQGGVMLFNVSVFNFDTYMVYLKISNDSGLVFSLTNDILDYHTHEFTGNILTAEWYLNSSYLEANIDEDDFLVRYKVRPFVYTSTTNPAKLNKSYYWLIGVISGIVVIGVVAISVFVYFRMKSGKDRYEKMLDLLKEFQITQEGLMSFKKQRDVMLIKPEQLSIFYESKLGQGSCSSIYKGHLSGPSPLHVTIRLVETQKYCNCDVAVKVARNFGPGESEQLYKEIHAMRTLGHHENILSLLGWAMADEKPCLVFDIAQNDLLRYAKELKNMEDLPYKDLLSILWQVTRGMEYIASKSLIHRDLAARNILLFGSNIAKISDFGLCCQMGENAVYQSLKSKKLPIKWLALESLTDQIFSEKSDVWSFGVLMYEMFTFGLSPYATMNNDEMLEFLRSGNRLAYPETMPNGLYEIEQHCWLENSGERPTFTELEQQFRSLIESETESYGYLTSRI